MTRACDLFGKIEEFLGLSQQLALTIPEELTLMSLDADEWQQWRSLSVPPDTVASPLLVRRLDYAIALLRRMLASSGMGAGQTGPRASRV